MGTVECIGWAERDYGWVQRFVEGRMVRVYCYIGESKLNSQIVHLNKRGILAHLPLWLFPLW